MHVLAANKKRRCDGVGGDTGQIRHRSNIREVFSSPYALRGKSPDHGVASAGCERPNLPVRHTTKKPLGRVGRAARRIVEAQ